MKRPWDYEQEFTADESGEVTQGGYFGEAGNRAMERRADQVEREEVRDMVAGARKRH